MAALLNLWNRMDSKSKEITLSSTWSSVKSRLPTHAGQREHWVTDSGEQGAGASRVFGRLELFFIHFSAILERLADVRSTASRVWISHIARGIWPDHGMIHRQRRTQSPRRQN